MDLVPKILLLLICLGHIQEVRGYICAVGRERDEYKVWRWVLPYAYPCGCTRVIMGGMNIDTPKRHFRPVYVDEFLPSEHVEEIRTHYGLQCNRKAPHFEYCPADQSMSTDPQQPAAMVIWDTPEAYDILGDMSAITCSQDSGSQFQIGETNVTCKATDNGYTAMCNFTIAVKDREAPIFTNCPAIKTSEPTLPETKAVVEYPGAIDNSEQAPRVLCNKEAGYKFPVGMTEVICEASDGSKNKATCKFSVHIINPEEPEFSFCPETQTNTTLHGQSFGVAKWNPPLATDNSGDTPNVTCDVESGSNFTIGRTDVTCMASDASGNKAMCNFTVSIIDPEEPAFSCPETQTNTTLHGQSFGVAEWNHPLATDNSGDTHVTCDVESGSNFTIGRTDVTCMASDASGNNATCNFTVSIIDPEEPAFSFCPETQTNTTLHGESFGVAEWNPPLATDNSGDTPHVTCDIKPGSNFTIGRTDVTCMASDASGNTATCNFTVSIIDCESLGTDDNPAFSCEQLMDTCQLPSGLFYVQRGQDTFQVYCNMDAFGGGWTRFGKGNMSSQWHYTNEDEQTETFEMISESEIFKIRNFQFTEFRVLTDVKFRLQGDDSVNPSKLSAYLLPHLTPVEMFINGRADHTHILFDESHNHIVCYGNNHKNKCGHGGLPAWHREEQEAQSGQLFIQSAFFGPRATGARAHDNQWRRNKYTWNGSYYYLLAK